jgi:histidinol-phosphate aminotransferase
VIKCSSRLSRVNRIFDPYKDRKAFIRLDRNEDPEGWDSEHFNDVIGKITPYDLSAYADSAVFVGKLSRWLKVNEAQIFVTAGSDMGIKTIFETYIDENDSIILLNPSWPMYSVYADLYNADPMVICFDCDLKVDVNQILNILNSKKVRMVVIANPNQPTGTLIEKEVMEKIIDCASKVETIVVVDEAYYHFTTQTCIDFISKYSNLIIVRTFSKAFGLASLRLGYCVAHQERINEMMLLRPVTDSNGLALKIGEYALDNIDWIYSRIIDFNNGRDYLYQKLIENGLTTFRSYCNFLIIRYDSLEKANLILQCVKENKYLLKGPYIHFPLHNCLRISTGPQKLMEKFWGDCGHILKV